MCEFACLQGTTDSTTENSQPAPRFSFHRSVARARRGASCSSSCDVSLRGALADAEPQREASLPCRAACCEAPFVYQDFRAACRPATSQDVAALTRQWRGRVSRSRDAGRRLAGVVLLPKTAGGLILASARMQTPDRPARAALLVSSRRMAPRLFWGLRDFGSWVVGGESAVFALAPTLPHTQKIVTGRYLENH